MKSTIDSRLHLYKLMLELLIALEAPTKEILEFSQKVDLLILEKMKGEYLCQNTAKNVI